MLIALSIFTAGCFSQSEASFNTARVAFDNPNSTSFTVDVADTVAEQTLGLGDTEILPADHGMLFIYPEADIYPFWMKEVEYPLDIIWIMDDTVVDITTNIPPEGAGTAYRDYAKYSPNTPVNMVLEVKAGVTEQENIAIGQHLTIEP